MTEQLRVDPWNDEVCQAWLDMAAEESGRLQLSSTEEGMLFRSRMPEPVMEYKMAQTAEVIGAGFARVAESIPGIMPETIQVIVDVNTINTD